MADQVDPRVAVKVGGGFPRSRHVLSAVLIAIWLFGLRQTTEGSKGPLDPLRERYGANWPGDLSYAIMFVTLETLVLAAVLRPWSYDASVRRVAGALGVIVIATIATTISSLHAGRILVGLWFWNLLLIPAFIVGIILALVHRHWAQFTDHGRP